jgi:universal stress protein E
MACPTRLPSLLGHYMRKIARTVPYPQGLSVQRIFLVERKWLSKPGLGSRALGHNCLRTIGKWAFLSLLGLGFGTVTALDGNGSIGPGVLRMSCFRKILVGVDLLQYRASSEGPTPAARDLVRRTTWLATKNSAELTFLSALNITEEALVHLEDVDRSHMLLTARQAAERVHAELVAEAQEQGIRATGRLAFGAGWLELIREVLRENHDLLMIGTRNHRGLHRMLFGSTGLKLLRRCPCPVWVSRANGEQDRALNILVASDLSPVAMSALRLTVRLAQVIEVKIHLLHVVDYPLDHLWNAGLPNATTLKYHSSMRAAAERRLSEQIEAANCRTLTPTIDVHIVDGAGIPDQQILEFVHHHHIDLLVMGTIARGGVQGIMIGNTAERLLPEVPCSVLAVKPPDFRSPVTLG